MRVHSRRPGRRGFTLIELLVVVWIVGFLALIGLGIYRGMAERDTPPVPSTAQVTALAGQALQAASAQTREPYRTFDRSAGASRTCPTRSPACPSRPRTA